MVNFKVIKALLFFFISLTSNAQKFVHFNTDIENYAQSLKLPTLVVAVAKGDSLIFFKSIGSAAAESQVPITPDHIFGVASLTKSFTSVVLQQLEAEGRISLADPVDKYPNKYFNKNRWTDNTTLAHIISHTSESRPVGTNFIYNGSKYNIVFNVFASLNPPVDTENITRPFTRELERRILYPLKMTHTLVRYNEAEHLSIRKFIVASYGYNDSAGEFVSLPVDITKMECGPGYGMMSSVNDLVKYSSALDNGKLISKQRFRKITSPFYSNSVQGEGWFTTNFEGIEICWGYGYGNSDASIFLKIPSKDLTLILLSSCSMPSETTRLGYGNPLNSPVVCSFIRNFVMKKPEPVQLNSEIQSIESEIQKKIMETRSGIYLEEAFANALVSLFNPTTSTSGKQKNIQLLKFLIKKYPGDSIWRSTTAIELFASLDDVSVLRLAKGISKSFYRADNLHPAKLYFAGVINEKLGNDRHAFSFFSKLAEGDAYNEQQYKFDALMKLAKYYERTDPEISKHYLENLIRYKEYISRQDDQYREAKEMLSKLQRISLQDNESDCKHGLYISQACHGFAAGPFAELSIKIFLQCNFFNNF